jgi:hypothetical protein
MAAGKWKLYDQTKLQIGSATWNFGAANSYKMALFTSVSNANTLTLATANFGALTGEVAAANGYTAGGVALTGQSYTNAAGVETFTIGNGVFNATGGSITARFAVIYAATTLNAIVSPIVCVSLLDVTPADVIVTSGNTLTIQINASGVFTVSGANVD